MSATKNVMLTNNVIIFRKYQSQSKCLYSVENLGWERKAWMNNFNEWTIIYTSLKNLETLAKNVWAKIKSLGFVIWWLNKLKIAIGKQKKKKKIKSSVTVTGEVNYFGQFFCDQKYNALARQNIYLILIFFLKM